MKEDINNVKYMIFYYFIKNNYVLGIIIFKF